MDNDLYSSPCRGMWVKLIVLIMPPLVLVGIFYGAISRWQPWYSFNLNWASAKTLGCGLGVLFHLSCWVAGAFKQDFRAVKNRVKEFFANISVSPGLAFKWYWREVKSYGVAFWIEIFVMAVNLAVFFDSLSVVLEIIFN